MARQRQLNSAGFEIPDDGVDQSPGNVPMPEVIPQINTPQPLGSSGGDDQNGRPIQSRGGETPRERGEISSQLRGASGAMENGGEASPARPTSPTSMAGSSFMAGGGAGLVPFTPMSSPSLGLSATPRSAGLLGSTGGLRGGGLGVPNDPISNNQSDPINSLISKLLGMGGQF